MAATAEKQIYLTQFGARKRNHEFTAPTGAEIEIKHEAHFKEDGTRVLKPTKKVATYALIQSHKDETEIENIVRRAVEGDYSVLQKRHGLYMDITGAPATLAEAQQFIMSSKEEFEKLPKEIKAKFEFNAEKYMSELATDTNAWLEKTGLAEKYRLEKQAAENAAKLEQDFGKAIENLAQGTKIETPNTEGVSN